MSSFKNTTKDLLNLFVCVCVAVVVIPFFWIYMVSEEAVKMLKGQ